MKPIMLTAAVTGLPLLVDPEKIVAAAQDANRKETRIILDLPSVYLYVKETPAEIACDILGVKRGPKPFDEPLPVIEKLAPPLPLPKDPPF